MKIIAIITGTSKGLGKAILEHCLQHGINVISINRTVTDTSHKHHLANILVDLSLAGDTINFDSQINEMLSEDNYSHVWLINNAAVLGGPKRMESNEADEIRSTLEVNLISHILLSNSLIKNKNLLNKELRLIHISSGAAFHPIHGLGVYCISKSGLEMFSKILATENSENNSFKSICFGPGVVDTDMQSRLRSSTKNDFAELDSFIELKERGILSTAGKVAKVLLKLLIEDNYISGNSYDLNGLIK